VETHYRSIIKAVTWRAGGTVVTCLVACIVTGSFDLAAKIGILDTVIKIGAFYIHEQIGAFYIHERFWNKVDFGKQKPPEYEI